jgi:sugar/nucleoside kinase (ribokinase family)
LGWEAAVVTSAAPDFEASRDLPGVACFVAPSRVTTRFVNDEGGDGSRRQQVLSRAVDVSLDLVPQEWRAPDVLLLSPVIGEVPPGSALAFDAVTVGAVAQGWLRRVEDDGAVTQRAWADPWRDLAGVHVLFLSEHDREGGVEGAKTLLECVPIVSVTRGVHGAVLLDRQGASEVAAWPRPVVDATGAGDVFATAFLVRYHEAGDPLEAASFAACAASCVVEGIGASTLGDRGEVRRRMDLRERFLEEGEWDED